MESPKHLPKAIFCFLDLNEINIVMREDEPKLYIYHFVIHWARLGELEPMYRVKDNNETSMHCSIHSEDSEDLVLCIMFILIDCTLNFTYAIIIRLPKSSIFFPDFNSVTSSFCSL